MLLNIGNIFELLFLKQMAAVFVEKLEQSRDKFAGLLECRDVRRAY